MRVSPSCMNPKPSRPHPKNHGTTVVCLPPGWFARATVAESYKKKVLILGDGAVGKTSLIRCSVVDKFSDEYVTTIGTRTTKKDITLQADGTEWNLSKDGLRKVVEYLAEVERGFKPATQVAENKDRRLAWVRKAN